MDRKGTVIAIVGIVGSSSAAIVACVGDDPGSENQTDAGTTPETSSEGSADGSTGDGGGGDGSAPCPDAASLSSDPKNCGACGKVCANGFGCSQGICEETPVDVAGGVGFGCALLHGGKVYCWGLSTTGALGVAQAASDEVCGGTPSCRSVPKEVPGITTAVKIATGDNHVCVAKKDGTASCWGTNNAAQLATSTATQISATPLLVGLPAGTQVTDVSAGQNTSCALTAAGEVYCWGDNGTSQVGKGAGAPEPIPFKVIAAGATAIRVGMDHGSAAHTCALVGNLMQCWGSNLNGESGAAAPPAQYNATPYPIKASGNVDFTGVTALSVGPGTTCAITNQGKTYCWGAYASGVVPSQPSPGYSYFPVHLPELPLDAVRLAQISWSHYVVTQGGDVWGWGLTQYGAIGSGTEDGGTPCLGGAARCASSIQKNPTLKNIRRLAAARNFGLAIDAAGKVFAWGINANAQLGHLPGTNGDVDCADSNKCQLVPKPFVGLP